MILATGNPHKVREMGEILAGVELEPIPEGFEMPPEDGDSFEANALIKARAVHRATGEDVIADDSGIVVDALDGRPGVHSARYAGPDAGDRENLDLLIEEMAGRSDRAAAYVCVIALVSEELGEELFEARCEGRLAEAPRGAGGFGYDPLFIPEETGPDDDRTMAELDPSEKHRISHRGRAAELLAERLGT